MTHRNLPCVKIVEFLVENKSAIKINNFTVTHWLNIICKRCRVKRRNCYQRNVNVTHKVADLHFHIPEIIDSENWPANSQYPNPVDFSVWGALQQKLYR